MVVLPMLIDLCWPQNKLPRVLIFLGTVPSSQRVEFSRRARQTLPCNLSPSRQDPLKIKPPSRRQDRSWTTPLLCSVIRIRTVLGQPATLSATLELVSAAVRSIHTETSVGVTGLVSCLILVLPAHRVTNRCLCVVSGHA